MSISTKPASRTPDFKLLECEQDNETNWEIGDQAILVLWRMALG